MSKAKSFSKYKSKVMNWQLFLTLARKRERKYVSRCCWCWLCEGKDKQSNTTWPPFAIFDCTGGNTIFWWGLMSGLSLIRLSDTFSQFWEKEMFVLSRKRAEARAKRESSNCQRKRWAFRCSWERCRLTRALTKQSWGEACEPVSVVDFKPLGKLSNLMPYG